MQKEKWKGGAGLSGGQKPTALIYDRLGLTMDGAYAVLQCAGALELSDNYDLSEATASREEKGINRPE
jgi:hypothetical protein